MIYLFPCRRQAHARQLRGHSRKGVTLKSVGVSLPRVPCLSEVDPSGGRGFNGFSTRVLPFTTWMESLLSTVSHRRRPFLRARKKGYLIGHPSALFALSEIILRDLQSYSAWAVRSGHVRLRYPPVSSDSPPRSPVLQPRPPTPPRIPSLSVRHSLRPPTPFHPPSPTLAFFVFPFFSPPGWVFGVGSTLSLTALFFPMTPSP